MFKLYVFMFLLCGSPCIILSRYIITCVLFIDFYLLFMPNRHTYVLSAKLTCLGAGVITQLDFF